MNVPIAGRYEGEGGVGEVSHINGLVVGEAVPPKLLLGQVLTCAESSKNFESSWG